MVSMLLQTNRLIIRAFKSEDLRPLTSLMTDADTMRYTGFKKPQTVERVEELLFKWRHEGKQKMGVWAVSTRDKDEFIGWVMLKPTINKTPELGYMIHRSHWGKGYASEAASGLLEYASNALSLSNVIAVTSANNIASMRVLEKAGMRKMTDVIREDGTISYEITFT